MTLTKEQITQVIEKSLIAREGSYSPYSKFRVGACLISAEDNSFILGANVENASYGGAICAERTAIVKGVSEGKRKFIGLAVSSDILSPISPCGICRQVLREFCPLDMPIYLVPSQYKIGSTGFLTLLEFENLKRLAGGEGGGGEVGNRVIVTSMGELLPMSFGPEDLTLPSSRN